VLYRNLGTLLNKKMNSLWKWGRRTLAWQITRAKRKSILRTLNPYLICNIEDGHWQFVSSAGTTYQIISDNVGDGYIQTGDTQDHIYDFSFKPIGIRNKDDENDDRIRETVISIIAECLDEGKFIQYICSSRHMLDDGTYVEDMTGKIARQRRILFGMWYKMYDCSDLYVKDDFHLGKGTELECYTGFIYRIDNPRIEGYRETIIPFILNIETDKYVE
jgi:hypothetical protein